jgi:DNA polymerase I-like protein with 3'-5' exonuclease and polymerase domains
MYGSFKAGTSPSGGMRDHSVSDQHSKKKYKKLIKRLMSQRDSSKSGLDLSADESLYAESGSEIEVPAEDEELKEYVRDFRKKVSGLLSRCMKNLLPQKQTGNISTLRKDHQMLIRIRNVRF